MYLTVVDDRPSPEFTTWTFPVAVSAIGIVFEKALPERWLLTGDFDGAGSRSFAPGLEAGGRRGTPASGFFGVIGESSFSEIQLRGADVFNASIEIRELAFAAVPEPRVLPALVVAVGITLRAWRGRRASR